MSQPTLCYGDLHWHTSFSDNRDRASVERMVLEGMRLGYRVLGTGDHNHNLTASAWQRERAESHRVAAGHPEIVLLNNCELTFLIGHFLALAPREISGTIEEAYAFLSGERDGLIMINHPGLPSDEWRARLLPHAAAVEVVNGAVLREAKRKGWRLDPASFPFDLPSAEVYAAYLEAGIAVGAIGSSDAHAVSELGSGVTGFWLESPGVAGVLEAVRARRTFAATDSAVSLSWSLDEVVGAARAGAGREGAGAAIGERVFNAASSRLRWECAFDGSGGEPEVQLFDRRRRIGTGGRRGELAVDAGGLYWIAARSGERFALSSPIALPDDPRGPGPVSGPQPADRPRAAAGRGAARQRPAAQLALGPRASEWLDLDRARLRLDPTAASAGEARAGEELELFSASPAPEIRDARGVRVEFEIVDAFPARAVIDKEAGPEALGEFLIWFERNEIHEYRFEGVEISFDDGDLALHATMLPYWADRRSGRGERFRAEGRRLAELARRCLRCRVLVKVPARKRLRIRSPRAPLPLRTLPDAPPDGSPGAVPEGTILRISTESGASRLEQYFLDSAP